MRLIQFGVHHGILVLSGDTAHGGKEIEYKSGAELIGTIRGQMAHSFSGSQMPVIAIAGNHDCNFDLADSIRESLLESLKPDRIDEAILSKCCELQQYYNLFASALGTTPANALVTNMDSIYRQFLVKQGGKTILFHLLNSAWMSQLNEKPGGLYYPVRLVKENISNAPSADIVLAVVHHPFNWYWPENGRELRKCLEDNADLILTGHEHVPGAYGKRTDVGEQNEYLEGGVLQETSQPGISSFNIVLFDTAQDQQQTFRFVWNGERYSSDNKTFWRPFERNKRLTRNQFQFSDSFFQLLEDPGAGYTHPLKDTLTLSDLFIYPDLQEVQYHQEAADRPVIRSREVVSFVLKHKLIMIIAEEKAGKTAFAKTLVKDLHRNGKIAILLNSDSLGKVFNADKLRLIVNEKLADQYGSNLTEKFWQEDSDKRAVIVDDFHKVPGNRKSKDHLAGLLVECFGLVTIMAGEEFRMEELAVPSSSESPLWQFRQCNVLQFGHVLRHSLVEKWCRLGREYTEEDIDVEKIIRREEDLVSKIISIDCLPSFPVFILILLQQLESTAKLTTTSGSFGYLYEVLVTASLSRRKAFRDDLDTMYTYLSEFAYHLFSNKKRAIPDTDLRTWHEGHCTEYRLPMDFGLLWKELVASAVIDSRHGEFRFRYKYLYYFFVARYFRDNINKPEIQSHIKDLSGKLYHENSANIMIFLCHLSKDERVLDAMLTAARGLFAAVERFDVSKQTAVFANLGEQLPELVLAATDPSDNHQKVLEQRDEQDRQMLANRTDRNDDDVDEGVLEGAIDELLLHNAAFKTIQILGQVLKNFAGSLRGTPKRQLVEECYGLGLRVLGNIFEVAKVGFPELVEIIVQQAKSRGDKPTTLEIQTEVLQLHFGLLQMVSFTVFKHMSDSVGTTKVAQTFEEILKNDVNPSVQVIDLSIRLDHYDHFPATQIDQLAKKFAGNMFAKALVRQLVWHYLYMFRVDYKNVQFACKKLEISLEHQPKLLEYTKKVNVKSRESGKQNDRKKRKGRGK